MAEVDDKIAEDPGSEEAAAMKAMGAAIRENRERIGLSLDVFSQKTGLSERALSKIETGTVQAKWGSLRRIANALDLPLPDLFKEGERRQPPISASD